jgi:hypothetical protein
MDGTTFWNAVGAIGTCVAAVVALLAYAHGWFRIRSIRLQGRWKGDLGDEWDFVAEQSVDRGRVKGRIRWTLIECPASLPWAGRIGQSGYELTEGRLESGVLTLSGVKVDNELISLSDYTIHLPLSGDKFEGKSRPKKRGRHEEGGVAQGTVSLSRKAILYFE